jgi:hypothetical protein
VARARQLKPGFFQNDQLAECSHAARLLFAGLWTIADREGRLEDRPRRLRAEIFPYEDLDADRLLEELAAIHESNGHPAFLLRYELEGHRFIQIVNFVKHQQPHYKEAPSVLPAAPDWQDSGVVVGGVPEDVRIAVIERDGKKCKRCGSRKDLTVDHIRPRSKGGTNDQVNLQTLCRKCNSGKNNRTSAQGRVKVDPTSAQGRPDDPGLVAPSSVLPLPVLPLPVLPLSGLPLPPSKTETETGRSAPAFAKPSLEQVAQRVTEKGYHFSAAAFVSHYNSNGWKVGRNAMKSWEDACTTWEERWKEENASPSTAPPSSKLAFCTDCHGQLTAREAKENPLCPKCQANS